MEDEVSRVAVFEGRGDDSTLVIVRLWPRWQMSVMGFEGLLCLKTLVTN
jgi:hypothetical protein